MVPDGETHTRADVLGVGLGWELGAQGLEWSELFPRVQAHARYVETAPFYEPRALDAVRARSGNDFRFVLHYSGLSVPGPETRVEPHFPVIAGLCRLLGSPWFVEDLGYWSVDGTDLGGFMPLILSEDSLETSIANVRALQQGVPFPYLPENPPFDTVIGELHILDYMRRLSAATGGDYLLDVGHLYSYLSLVGEPPESALAKVDWARVPELHVAGGEFVRGPGGGFIYDDNHSKPILPEVLELLALMLPRAHALRALTVEIDFNQAGGGVGRPLDVAVRNFYRAHEVAERCAPWLVAGVPQVLEA